MSGTAVDWDALKIPGIAPRARPRPRCWYPVECPHGYDACPTCDRDALTLNLEPGQIVEAPRGGVRFVVPFPRVVLDATREIYRALKIHHTTARMAALALYHAGLLK